MKFFQYYDENHTVRLGFCRGELLADAQASVKKSGAEIPTTLTDVLHHADRKTVLEAYQTIEPVAISGEISFAPAGTPDPVQSRFHPYVPYSLSQCR